MRRSGLRPLVASLALALGAAACGSSHGSGTAGASGSHAPTTATATSGSPTPTTTGATSTSSGTAGLTITPSHPRPSSTIAFTFTAPTSAGRHGQQVIGYMLDLAGPAGTSCAASHQANVPSAGGGAAARVLVTPDQFGGRWCVGAYTARVQELARAACASGQMCPMYVRVIGTVAEGRFTVSR